MKVSSATRPPAYKLDTDGSTATIRFADSVTETTVGETDEEKETLYEYNSYELTVPSRDNLEKDVSANYEIWLNKAKEAEKEKLASEVRAKRNKLLEDTDKDILPDRETANNEALISYRKALRDIPEQEGFPYDVKFPSKPII